MFIKQCPLQNHKKAPIKALCLQKNCKFKRLLCTNCLSTSHSKHDVTLLNTKFKECKLLNLEQNHNVKGGRINQDQIDGPLKYLLTKFKAIYDRMENSRSKCYQATILNIQRTIRQSFFRGAIDGALNVILQQDTCDVNLTKIEKIAEKIRNLEKPHIKDMPLLLQTLQIMLLKLQQVLESTQNTIYTTLDRLQKQVDQWSIFNDKNWIKLMAQLNQNQQNINQQQRLKQTERQKNLFRIAKENNWKSIEDWVHSNKKLGDMQKLELNGKREGLMSSLFGGSIRLITGLQCLKNLKILDLGCNHICIIEGLQELTRLQYLYLYSNNIERIQNLETLICLRGLFLGSNKIDKIENLQKLKLLQKLSLSTNKIRKIENLLCLVRLEEVWMYDNPLLKKSGKYRQEVIGEKGIIQALQQRKVKLRLKDSKS